MHYTIHAHGFELTEEFKGYTERRLNFALSWAAGMVTKVDVRCTDENGPRGGFGNRCTLHIHLAGGDDLVVKDVQPDICTAIDRAADRAGRSLARKIQRKHKFRNETLRQFG
jgi:ribosome-associated translation inhibitor RaiA